jgi:hypothetical protein
MADTLREAKQRLAREIDSQSVPTVNPIAADPWVISSLVQKSIRRGETDVAQSPLRLLHEAPLTATGAS